MKFKIRNMDQYNEYCEIHERLSYSDYNSNQDEIELIEILIDEFEMKHVAFNREYKLKKGRKER